MIIDCRRTTGSAQTGRWHIPDERIRRQAAQIGSNAEAYVEVVMRERKHPEQRIQNLSGRVAARQDERVAGVKP